MDKDVTLVISRLGCEVELLYESVKAAACEAWIGIETKQAMPLRIKMNGETVWTNMGLFSDSYDRLRELANLHSKDNF